MPRKYWLFSDDVVFDNDLNIKEGMISLTFEDLANKILSNKLTMERAKHPRSIPTPWARPLLFQQFLCEDNMEDTTVKRYVSEWRGMLAMLALYPIYEDWRVEIEQINFKDNENSVDQVIHEMKPSIPEDKLNELAIFAETKWDEICAIKLRYNIIDDTTKENIEKEYIVGITSPTTIICPGNVIENIKEEKAPPWIGGKRFKCPIDDLSFGEKLILFFWLKKLKRYIDNDKQTNISILKHLDSYINDLDLENFYENNKQHYVWENLFDNGDNDRGKNHKDMLDFKVKLNGSDYSQMSFQGCDQNKSLCLLLGLKDEENKEENIIIWGFLDKNIYKRMTEEGVTQNIIKETFIDELKAAKEGKLKNAKGIVLIDTDRIFLEKLYTIIASKESRINFNGVEIVDNKKEVCVIPINKEYYQFIYKFIKLKHNNESNKKEGAIINIKINFDNGKERNLKEEYTDILYMKEKDLPHSIIYPNLKGCNKYFFFNVTQGDEEYYFAPLSHEASIMKRVYSLDSYCDFVGCYLENNYCIGAIELKDVVKGRGSGNNNIIYALDFGTSSSTIACKINQGAPFMLSLNNMFNEITINANHENNSASSTSCLIFPTNKSMECPFPSIFYKYNHIAEDEETYPFILGHPYFIQYEPGFPDTLVSDSEGKFYANMKTDFNSVNDETCKDMFEAYICAIFTMILCDAISNGDLSPSIRFSYPLSKREYTEYINMFISQFKKACEIVNIEYKQSMIKHTTESEAAIKAFKSGLRRGNLVIDIGGGTTDIFVQSEVGKRENKIFSIEMGARRLLLEVIRINPDITSFLTKGIGGDVIDPDYIETLRESSNDFHTIFESIFPLEGKDEKKIGDVMIEKSKRKLRSNGIREDKEGLTLKKFKLMKTLLALRIMAIVFYTGILFKAVEKNINEEEYRQNLDIQINFCGNGSKVIKWLGENSEIKSCIKKFFSSGYENDSIKVLVYFPDEIDNDTFQKTPLPKTEVALGMINNKKFKLGKNTQVVPMGEELKKESNTIAAEDEIDFINGHTVTSYESSLRILEKFFSNTKEDSVFCKELGLLSFKFINNYDKLIKYDYDYVYISREQLDAEINEELNNNLQEETKIFKPYFFHEIDIIAEKIEEQLYEIEPRSKVINE